MVIGYIDRREGRREGRKEGRRERGMKEERDDKMEWILLIFKIRSDCLKYLLTGYV